MWASIGVGVALASLSVASQRALRGEIADLRSDLAELREGFIKLRERMAHLEGLLEGLRVAALSRITALPVKHYGR